MSRSIIATASRRICRISHVKRFYSVSRTTNQLVTQANHIRTRGNRTKHIDEESIDDNIVLEDLSQEGSFTYSTKSKPSDNQTIPTTSDNPTSEHPADHLSDQPKSSDQYDVSNFNILPDLAAKLKDRFNITHLTPIQADVFNHAINGKDIVARSKTGSGKTLAFLLPIIQSLRTNQLANPSEHYPRHREAKCVILQPTRELAMQTAMQVKKLIEQSNNQTGKQPIGEEITVAVVYGGTPYPKQELELARGVDILIATPGRLLDHMARKNVTLSATSHIVLDEADEMMRCGFVDDVLMILKHANSKKQMMLFSATLPKWVEAIIEKHVKPDREWIDHIDQPGQSVDQSVEVTQTPTTIAHQAMCCPTEPNERASLIASIIDNHLTTTPNGRIIVFVSERVDAMFISSHPSMRVPSKAMTGEQAQTRRDAIMDGFRAGVFRVLVATDIAARGIDIPSVSLIVHAYFPEQSEAYVHRSGRTGRAGHAGASLVLYQPKERAMIGVLSERIGAPIEHIYPPNPHTGKNQSVNQAIEKSIGDLIEKHSSSLSTYTELSEKLLAEHGSKALSCLLSAVFHPRFSSRSLLTSSSAYTTVQLINPSKGKPMTKDAIIQRLQYLIGRPDIGAGRVEHGDHVALVDLKNEAADQLRLKLDQAFKTTTSNDQSILPSSLDDVSFPSELPVELFTNQSSNAVRELKARWAAGKSRYGHTIKEEPENPDHRDRGPDARGSRKNDARTDRSSGNEDRSRQSRGPQHGRPGARSTENTRRRLRY